MRTVLYGGAALGIAMLSSPDTIRSALATSASALVEAAPFVFGGVLAMLLFRRGRIAIVLLGCGCDSGPSARSIPVVAATWLLFGPLVAVTRWLAALLVARLVQNTEAGHDDGDLHPLGQLAAMLPAVALAGVTTQLFAAFDLSRLSPVSNALTGAALGFAVAPCGLGAIALAGSLRTHAPIVATAFLCVAGIIDLRAWIARRSALQCDHDALAYVLLASALTIVAVRHGDALVRPALSPLLAACAVAALYCCMIHRRRSSAPARIAPSLMLVGALVGAPPPTYHATETTLTDLFAGERLSFTGALSCEQEICAIVRFAITCCRADAAPVAVRLDSPPRYPAGSWLHVDGRIERFRDDLRLVPDRVARIAPPTDPFIYR